jgi:hypothetical protein
LPQRNETVKQAKLAAATKAAELPNSESPDIPSWIMTATPKDATVMVIH